MKISLGSLSKIKLQQAFTLVELVVGIVVISIAFVLLSTMLYPQAERSADTLHRVRSAELAHSILNEIWGKRYDQNTNANGGVPACGAAAKPALGLPAGLACTASANLGPDAGETRNDFNDVDDYAGLNINSLMLNSTATYADRYKNYALAVSVQYDNLPSLNTKLVTIDVTTPSGEVMTFNAIRSNY
ncbi:type II secretion system protein [Shewanella halifaxensis]|uniref:type II secretion system protein n=1 Tax=Shewanella halifaxensis TaxID=271098 RepID=UPI000D59DC93|nr:type II secretion system protein [Shewanella halifaxensis]